MSKIFALHFSKYIALHSKEYKGREPENDFKELATEYEQCFDVLCNLLSGPQNELYIKSMTIFNRLKHQHQRFSTENVGNNLTTSHSNTFTIGLKPTCLSQRVTQRGFIICDCQNTTKVCLKKKMHKTNKNIRGGFRRGRGGYRGGYRGNRGRGQ